MIRRRGPVATFAAVATMLSASACGVRPDAEPRDVPAELQVGPGAQNDAGEAQGTFRIYLVGPDENRLLRSVPRASESESDLIEVLFAGPNDTEVGYGSAIPAGLTLQRAPRQRGSKLVIDVGPELLDLSGSGLVQALAQIVYTGSELDGVASVEVRVEDQLQAWPTADLDTTTEPLTVFDYAGMVRTAQPDYPSVPAGD